MLDGFSVYLEDADSCHYIDDLAAFRCDRREHYDSDEEYMHMVRNPEEYC
jgi:hypothetical protein